MLRAALRSAGAAQLCDALARLRRMQNELPTDSYLSWQTPFWILVHPNMPSNQYKPLVKPKYGNSSHRNGGIGNSSNYGSGSGIRRFFQAPNLVPRCYRALTMISAMMITASLLASFGPFTGIIRNSSKSEQVTICDPFLLPGFFAQLPSGLATYRTYDSSCNVQGYLPALLAALRSSPYHTTALPPSQLVSKEAIQSKVTNKTVIMIGDETDHFLVQHFCTLVGQSVVAIDRHHPWGESLIKVPKEHAIKITDHNSYVSTDPGQKALAHYCHIPDFDFLLVSTYHLGGDIGDTFQGLPAWTAPGLFENRMEDLYVPLINSMAQKQTSFPNLPPARSHPWPDAVILSSSFWDLARFASEDSTMMRSLVEDLSEHRLFSWRSRYVDMLTGIQNAWKDSKVGWRSLPAPPDAEQTTLEWWTGAQTDDTKTVSMMLSTFGTT